MPRYPNGRIPESALVVFHRGHNATDGDFYWGLPPASYQKHLALVARAQRRTGRGLSPSQGWSCYRPMHAQELARRIYGNGAAVPGTSSHGGFWEGRDTSAVDYGNWAWVYQNHGGRAAFFEDCRAVGLEPDMISPRRGYPDEPWHVIDMNPWAASPILAGVDFTEDDMPSVEEILDYNIPRQGGQKGTTNLRQIIAWFDNAIISLDTNNARRVEELKAQAEEKANAIAQHVTRVVSGIKVDGAEVDPELIRSAVTEAVEKALGGTTLDPQVTAKAVREEFRADPLS